MDGQNEWMDGWMDGWVGGWVGGRMAGLRMDSNLCPLQQ